MFFPQNNGASCKLRIKFITYFIAVSLILILTACSGKPLGKITDEPSPEIVITAWAGEVVGELSNIDGCIRVSSEEYGIDYALVWTPDISATIEGDKIRIIFGLVRKDQTEVLLQFGETVRVSGGETTHPDEQLLKNLPSSCQGPYWVVGFEITPIQATLTP